MTSKAVLVLEDGRIFTGTPFGAVGQTHSSDRRRQLTLEADARRQTGEKQTAGHEDTPHLPEHRLERSFVLREVQNGTADDRVRRTVLPRKRIERPAMNVLLGTQRIQRGFS